MFKNIYWGIISIHQSVDFNEYLYRELDLEPNARFKTFIMLPNILLRSSFIDSDIPLKYSNKVEISEDSNTLFSYIEVINNGLDIFFISDDFGQHSLYWTYINGICFFSNSSFFLAKLLQKKPKGKQGLFMHLILRGQRNYESYFEDIEQLPPQSILHIDEQKITVKKRILDNLSKDISFNTLLSDFSSTVLENIGITLSGGIDSSVVAYEASLKHKNIKCYTLINPHSKELTLDSKYAQLLSKEINILNVEVPFVLNDNIFYYDMPILDHDIYGQYCLSQYMIKDGKSILLSGSGADELFGGYDRIFKYTYALWKHKHLNIEDSILSRYSYTDFNLLRDIDLRLFNKTFDDIKGYYLQMVNANVNPIIQLHHWFIYHHLFWILKMTPANIRCVFPYLKSDYLKYCLETEYMEIFPYLSYEPSDPYYDAMVKNILKQHYKQKLPLEILKRPKLPFSVQETEISKLYTDFYYRCKPELLIPQYYAQQILDAKYGEQTKLLYLSYILWRDHVL